MLFLLMILTSSLVQAETLERLEASVNNQLVLKSDIGKFKKTVTLRAQLDPLFAGTDLAKKGIQATDTEIVDFLVNEKLITTAFPVSDAEVEQELNTIQAANRINREQLRGALTAQGFKFDDYFELIRIGASKRNLIDRDIRTKVSITDDDVKNQYYNRYAKDAKAPQAYHIRIITTPVKKDAQDARAELVKGKPFAEVAKKYSKDPSAENGGDLGVSSEEQMAAPIRKQIKKMRVGETSAILGNAKTQFFIIRLDDIQKAEDAKFKALSDQIRGGLANVEYQRQLTLWFERQRDLAFIHRAGDPSIAGLPKGP